jgi:hypothetical protein
MRRITARKKVKEDLDGSVWFSNKR